MTIDELRDALEVRNPPFPIRVDVEPERFAGVGAKVILTATVRDRDTGKETPIAVGDIIGADYLAHAEPEAIVARCYSLLCKLFLHEAAEAFHWKGVRVRDPHAGEKTP